jgi:hypothetical protein
MKLLFVLAHWHGLAKLRLHTDTTLDILDQLTSELGDHFRSFISRVCDQVETKELVREYQARKRRDAQRKGRRQQPPAKKAQSAAKKTAASTKGVSQASGHGTNLEASQPRSSHGACITSLKVCCLPNLSLPAPQRTAVKKGSKRQKIAHPAEPVPGSSNLIKPQQEQDTLGSEHPEAEGSTSKGTTLFLLADPLTDLSTLFRHISSASQDF